MRRGLACFAKLAIAEGQNFEIAARTPRLAKCLDEAEKLVECGAIRLATQDYVGAREARERARALYERCGCRGRVGEIEGVLRASSWTTSVSTARAHAQWVTP